MSHILMIHEMYEKDIYIYLQGMIMFLSEKETSIQFQKI